jgi:GxxExxY protein
LEHGALTEQVLAAAFEVHTQLGPGLLESAYEACLAHELRQRGLRVEQQQPVSLVYKGVRVDVGYRIDLVVERTVVVELKAVEQLTNVHQAQVISYLRVSGYPVGLLINFYTRELRAGIRRFVNTQPANPPRSPCSPC